MKQTYFKPEIQSRLEKLSKSDLTKIGEMLPKTCTYQNVYFHFKRGSRLPYDPDYMEVISKVLNVPIKDLTHKVLITQPHEHE